MKTLFKNATIIKNFDEVPLSGDLVVEDDKIIFVGKQYTGMFDKVIDACQNILMPGFIDCHTHSAMEIFKGISGGKVLQDWLFDMQKMERNLTGSDVYYGTYLANFEFAKNGITTVNDNYYYADFATKAFMEAGIRAVMGIGQRYSIKKFLTEKELETLYSNITSKSPLISANFYCHSIYNADEKMFATNQILAKRHNTFVSTHVSETLEEVGKCASFNNDLSPIGLLEQYGFFDVKSLAIHSTNVDENDIQILAKYKSSVCANFGSNYKLASGVAPIFQMSKYGINVCLGTDGSASNNRLDMFREMYLASTSQNILLSNTKLFESKDILKMATINGAKALGLKNVGTLEIGNYADIIMLKNNDIDGLNSQSIFDNLVYSYGTEDIILTMCNGKILYQNGKYNFPKTKNAIIKRLQQIIQRLESVV